MIKEATGVASTIEEARQQALRALNAPQEADVKVEIVQQPKKKILGLFGGADAKVKAYYDDGKSEKKPAPKKEFSKPASKPQQKASKEPAQKNNKKEQPKAHENAPKAQKEAPAKTREENKPQKKSESSVDLSQVPEKKTDATEYLEDILKKMGFDGVSVTVKEVGDDYYFEISGTTEFGGIIGKRGETLDALQYITRLYLNRDASSTKRVSLNVGDYREKRKETLENLAVHKAQRAISIGKSTTLEPMNPYERRIVHTAIQGVEGVTSHSVGDGDNRRVVIVPDNARFDRRGGKNYGRNNNYGRREKRAPYVPEAPKEPREQKVDAVSSSRYGKIEPKKPASDAE